MRLTSMILYSIFIIVLSACSSNSGNDESASYETSPKIVFENEPKGKKLTRLLGRIGEHAIAPMTTDQYPKNYRKFGSNRFEQANELTIWATVHALENQSCSYAEYVGVSDSSTKLDIEWYIDCNGRNRVRVNESQAQKSREKWEK